MNWRDLVENDSLARAQNAYERRHRILAAYRYGADVKMIAKYDGVSLNRVYQMIRQAQDEQMRRRKAPIERYLRHREQVILKRLTKAEAAERGVSSDLMADRAARQKAVAEAVTRMLGYAEPYLKLVKQPLGKP